MKPLIHVFAAIAATLTVAFPARSATHDVAIQNSSFHPPQITIKAGDTVRWTNQDFLGHTVTGDTQQEQFCGSQTLFNGGTCLRTFNTVGTFAYHCQPHPFMTGSVTVEPAGPTPPTVAITSPANGASFTGPTNVTIQATANDADGTVTNVAFFDGGTLLGNDNGAPYEVIASLALGQHVLTAVATDSTGLNTTSAPVTINITSPRVTNPIAERIAKGEIAIELQVIAEGLQSPLGFAVPDDNSGRILVYDQAGLIWVLNNGVKEATPMLDVRSRMVLLGGYDERGLLGVAVHPDFANFPFVYTYTSESNSGPATFTHSGTGTNHQSVIAEWRIDPANPLRIDPASRREVMRIDQPQSNHNGGTMRFGPDGLLYISLGDGGSADDQGDGHVAGGNAQHLENVYGKLIRIDVNARTSVNGQYGVPADNPFVGVAGIDEIYAYGLRNPFAFSFDRVGGALYLADVGQNAIEELDVIVKGGNYGWRVKEGTFYFDPNGSQAGYVTTIPVEPEPPNLIDPIAQYDHDDGLAIVGGYVYRGTAIPALAGKYVTGDWGNFNVPSGRLFYLDSGNVFKEFIIGRENRHLGEWLRGFGEGPDGELYVCVGKSLGPVGNVGRVLKIVPLPPEIDIGGVQNSGGSLNAQWTGGSDGPYALQKKETLADLSWNDILNTANSSASAPTEATTGFFRIGDMGSHSGIPLTAALNGAFERPSVATTGAGFAIMRMEGNLLYIDLRYSGLSSAAFAAHIHGPANMSQSAGVLVDLGGLNGGAWGTSGTLSGTVPLTPELKALILDGRTYINIHTGNNQGGEIRGQIVPVLFQAFATGASERPTPRVTPATAQSTMFLVGTQLTFNIAYENLLSTATVAHIHGPAPITGSAGVIVDLAPFHNGPLARVGSFSGTVALAPNLFTQVVDRLTYVNIHSTNYPAGEIRGQIIPKGSAIALSASLNGTNERPSAVSTPASGFGSFRLDGNDLFFEIVYTNLTSQAIAAHIHGPASSGTAAGILIDLGSHVVGSFGRHGALAGLVRLTPAQRALILSAQTYVNIHSANHTGGEIRGHVAPVLMFCDLKGNNESPAVPTAGFGQATLLLVGNRLWFDVTYRNLTQAATMAHIHAPSSPFGTAGIRVDLAPFNGGAWGTSGSLMGVVTLGSSATATTHDIGSVIDGSSYINIHSSFRTGGEIRGTILR